MWYANRYLRLKMIVYILRVVVLYAHAVAIRGDLEWVIPLQVVVL